MNTCMYFHIFSTNHVCVRGSSAVQGLGVTGVLLPGRQQKTDSKTSFFRLLDVRRAACPVTWL